MASIFAASAACCLPHPVSHPDRVHVHVHVHVHVLPAVSRPFAYTMNCQIFLCVGVFSMAWVRTPHGAGGGGLQGAGCVHIPSRGFLQSILLDYGLDCNRKNCSRRCEAFVLFMLLTLLLLVLLLLLFLLHVLLLLLLLVLLVCVV